jgi:hypothetical protein
VKCDFGAKYQFNGLSIEKGRLLVDRHELIIARAVQHNILGSEGQEMQAEVWKEVLTILEEKFPEVREVAHPTM